jgi:hypothetical protein
MSQQDPNRTFNRVFIGLGIVLFSIGISMTGLGTTLLGTVGPNEGTAANSTLSSYDSGAAATVHQSTKRTTTTRTAPSTQASSPTQLSTRTAVSSPIDTTPNQTDTPSPESGIPPQGPTTNHNTRTTMQSGSGEDTAMDQESKTTMTKIPNQSDGNVAAGTNTGELHSSPRGPENHPNAWAKGDLVALFIVCFGGMLLVGPTVYSYLPV